MSDLVYHLTQMALARVGKCYSATLHVTSYVIGWKET